MIKCPHCNKRLLKIYLNCSYIREGYRIKYLEEKGLINVEAKSLGGQWHMIGPSAYGIDYIDELDQEEKEKQKKTFKLSKIEEFKEEPLDQISKIGKN